MCEPTGSSIADWKVLLNLKNGEKISWRSLPLKGEINYRFRIPVKHDTVACDAISSDSFERINWGPEKISDGPTPSRYYRFGPYSSPLPMTPGKYSLSVEAFNQGKSVAKRVIQFTVVDNTPPPRNTHFLDGKKDFKGNPITCSKPVDLGGLNETSTLKDNDYPFEPQQAYYTINFERFPPFSLPPRFIQVWGTRRFTDEAQIGGPLNRGFTAIATYQPSQDNLTKIQRNYFHTEGLQIQLINEWYKKDPKKYQDLKNYISDGRSLFVSEENAYELGKACYSSCGTYGWDEEWIGDGGGLNLFKKYPEMLPAELLELKKKDPEAKLPETQKIVTDAYVRAWGDFIGNGYRGARDAAKAQGRTIKVWHYGSKAPNTTWFRPWEDVKPNPVTGKYGYEDIGRLPSWFKTGGKVNFYASEYSRQIDYYSHDFYYWNAAPQYMSMYEKDAQGKYVLDSNGRRKIRHDKTEEKIYVDAQPFDDDDYENMPIFLKSFLAKGENCLFFQNGAKYYKKNGTCITHKQLIPFHRLRDQETGFGRSTQLGSRAISPYYAEAATIYTFMMGLEGLYYWDAGNVLSAEGQGNPADSRYMMMGETEFVIKGLHRVSQFKDLFEGDYYYVRPFRHYDTVERDNPIIRGILNDRNLVLAMTNPYLDPGETQEIEIWYGAPYGQKAVWSNKVILNARKTGLFQCKLPKLPKGQAYDPDRLYFRYSCADGNYQKTHMVTGNYDLTYEKSIQQAGLAR